MKVGLRRVSSVDFRGLSSEVQEMSPTPTRLDAMSFPGAKQGEDVGVALPPR